MARIKGLDIILTHLYSRAKNNLPLVGGPEEEIFSKISSLGKNPLYKKIKLGMERGKSLSETLSIIKGFPPFFLQIIKRGEDSGNLAKALKIVLDHFSIFTRFKFHIWTIYTYVFAILLLFLAFVCYYSHLFVKVHAIASEHSPTYIPDLFRPFFIASNQYFIVFVVFLIIVLLVLALKRNLIDFFIKRTPVMSRNYFRILSLELGTICSYNLELGLPLNVALAKAVEGVGDKKIYRSLKKMLLLIEKGEPFSKAMSTEPILKNMPVINVMGLGEATGKGLELINELNNLLHQHLANNLDRDMRNLFRWCVVFCGILVGAGTIYVFNAILSTYSFMTVL